LIISGSRALGLHREGAGDRGALLLAARQLGGQLARLVGDAHPIEQGHRPLLGRLSAEAAHLDGAERDVLEDRLVREEVEGLEHHAHVGSQLREALALLGQRHAVDRDGAGVDRLETVDGAAQGRLTRSRGPEHDHHLAAADLGVDVVEHVQLAVVLVDRVHDHERFAIIADYSDRCRLSHGPIVGSGLSSVGGLAAGGDTSV
jgi:hypothetical protein